jgi:hypothetical protein
MLLSERLLERGDTRERAHTFSFSSEKPALDANRVTGVLPDAQVGYTERRVYVRIKSTVRTDWVEARRLIGFIFTREIVRTEARVYDEADLVLERVERAWTMAGLPRPDRMEHGV